MRSIFAAVVVAILVVPAFGQPLADKVPADAVVYIGWRGTDNLGKGYDQSHLKAMVELSQFDVMWAQAWPKLIQKATQGDANKRQEMEDVGTLLATLWHRPVAMAFSGVELKDKMLPKMAVLIDGGKEANKIADALTHMIEKEPNPDVPVKVRVEGTVVVMDVGLGVKLAADKASSLAGSPRFVAALKHVEGDAVLLVYADGEGLVNTIEQGVAGSTDVETQKKWPALRDALGLNGLRQVVASGSFDKQDWRWQAFVGTAGARTGLLALLDTPPLEDQTLKLIPKDATYAAAGSLDISRIMQAIRTLVQIDPNAGAEMAKGLEKVNQTLGLDIEKDLLAGVGDQWAAFGDSATGGDGMLGYIVMNRVKDQAKLKESLGKLQGKANDALKDNFPMFGMEISFRQAKRGDLEINYLATPLVSPSWAIKDGNLYLAMFPQVVAGAAGQMSKKGPSILDNPQFTALRTKLGGQKKINSIEFHDLLKLAPQNYQTWLLVAQIFQGAADLFGAQTPAMALPPLADITPHLSPSGTVTWTDDAGWHMNGITPFPGSEMLASSPLGLLLGGNPIFSAMQWAAMGRERHVEEGVVVPEGMVEPAP